MKQVKILKRPAQSPPPSNPADRVTTELATLLESCLSRERARLEEIYQARHEALLTAVSTVLNQSLQRLVSTAVHRETDVLMTAFNKLGSTDVPSPTPPDPEATRAAFAAAFERMALPRFEDAVATLLRDVAATVDGEVDAHFVQPASAVVANLGNATDAVRAAKTQVSTLSVHPDDPDAQLSAALDAGDAATALKLALAASAASRTRAVAAVLDLPVAPEDVLASGMPRVDELARIAGLLAADLGDRTAARLKWLMDIVAVMEDAEPGGVDGGDGVELMRRALEDAIEKLTDFHKGDAGSPGEKKDAKLLVRVFKAHLPAKTV